MSLTKTILAILLLTFISVSANAQDNSTDTLSIDDDISVLEIVKEYEDKVELLKIESNIDFQKHHVEVIRKLKKVKQDLIRADELDQAKSISNVIDEFRSLVFVDKSVQAASHLFANPQPLYFNVKPNEDKQKGEVAPLPTEVQSILQDYDIIKDKLESEQRKKMDDLSKKAIAGLQRLKDDFANAGKLDAALKAREAFRLISRGYAQVNPDPGYLNANPAEIGRSIVFEVVGSTRGPVVGTRIYCCGSYLPAVAVHAGILEPNQKGLVRVTILPGRASYTASSRNGVTSMPYSSYPISFKIEAVTPVAE